MQPPAQELQAKDLHDNQWTFRHIYRGKSRKAIMLHVLLGQYSCLFCW